MERRSERTRHQPNRYGVWLTDHHDLLIIENDEPTSYGEARMGPDSDKWLEAAKWTPCHKTKYELWLIYLMV